MADGVAEYLDKLPKKLKVGPHTYSVTLVDELRDGEDLCWGLCSENKLSLTLSRGIPSITFAAEVAMHEVLHALWATRELEDTGEEEKIITNLSIGLMSFYQDNPRFLTWLKKGLKKS